MAFNNLFMRGLDFVRANVYLPPATQPQEEVHGEADTSSIKEPSTFHMFDAVFEQEEETDYTPGPAKMVMVNEEQENKQSVALLLSYDLSRKMQQALMGRRDLQTLDLELGVQRDQIEAREHELMAYMVETDNKLDQLKMKYGNSGENAPIEQQQEMQELRDVIANAEKETAELKSAEEQITQHWYAAQGEQQILQDEFGVILDDVFVKCELLPQTDAPVAPSFEQAPQFQYTPLHPDLEGSDYKDDPANDANGAVVQTAEMAEASRVLAQSQRALLEAQWEFETHQNDYDGSLQRHLDAQVNRPIADSKVEHDLLYLQRGRTATRRVLDAEEAVQIAKAAAKSVGVPHDGFQGSHFADCPDDGYRDSQELETAGRVDRTRIQAWIDSAEAGRMGSPSLHDMEEWSVDFEKPFDSISVIAEGRDRQKIDQWRQQNGLVD